MPSLKFRIYQLNLRSSYDYYTFILEKLKPNESFIALGIVDVKELLQKNPNLTFAYFIRGFFKKRNRRFSANKRGYSKIY